MRAAVEHALRASWAGRGGVGGAAFRAAMVPAELAFRWAVALRRLACDSGLVEPTRAPVPVICVGNLTVGGTGKTPLARWVVDQLAAAGRKPAVVARGYGRDELLLHRRWHPDVPVHADRDRARAALAAAAEGADVLVLDDGFQHRALARDLDLVAVSAEQPFPGPLLPRGPYREPASALGRATWIVVTRRLASAQQASAVASAVRGRAPAARVARVRLAPIGWTRLDGERAPAPTGDVVAVAAVADPDGFARMVERETGAAAELLAFADHHEYTAHDLERIARAARGRTVVTTEKDAVKLAGRPELAADVRVLALGVDAEEGEGPLRAALLEAAGAAPAAVRGDLERIV